MNKKKAFLSGFALSILLLILVVLSLIFKYQGDLSVQQTKASMENLGVMAPVVFIGMCILRGVVFLPCGILSALGGAAFGKLPGTIFTLFGLTAGSILTFYLARVIGKDWAKNMLGHRYDRYEGYVSKDFPYSIFLMRVLPILPYDAVSCISGMSRVGVGKYILETLLGSLPGVFIYVYFGDSVRSMSLKRVAFSVAFIGIFAIVPFIYKYSVRSKQKVT
jgi:uncharacterized membrane protein YdjX (TVP38/TMEM64 family)